MSSTPGFGTVNARRVLGSRRWTVIPTFASARRVPVPAAAFTLSHQYLLTCAAPVIMSTHHVPFGSYVCTDVSWTFCAPPNTSWEVWTWLNVVFRMSKSTVFAFPSSVSNARLVTPVNVASQRLVFCSVLVQGAGARNELRTGGAFPPNKVEVAVVVGAEIVSLASAAVVGERP